MTPYIKISKFFAFHLFCNKKAPPLRQRSLYYLRTVSQRQPLHLAQSQPHCKDLPAFLLFIMLHITRATIPTTATKTIAVPIIPFISMLLSVISFRIHPRCRHNWLTPIEPSAPHRDRLLISRPSLFPTHL